MSSYWIAAQLVLARPPFFMLALEYRMAVLAFIPAIRWQYCAQWFLIFVFAIAFVGREYIHVQRLTGQCIAAESA